MKTTLIPLHISTIDLFNRHINKQTGLFDLQSFNHAVIELREQQQVSVEPVVKPEIAEGTLKKLFDVCTCPQYANADGHLIYKESETPIYVTTYEDFAREIKKQFFKKENKNKGDLK